MAEHTIALSGTELAATERAATLVDAAAGLGVDAVEIWYPANTGADAVEVLRSMDRAGIRVVAISTACDLATPGRAEPDRETLFAAVALAREAGVALVNTYFGIPAERDDDANIRTFLAEIAPVLRAAERSGVTVCLENEFDCFAADPAAADVSRRAEGIRRLLELADTSALGVTFDACNAYFAGLDPLAALAVLREWVVHVHVKDGVRGSDRPADPHWRRFSDLGVPCQTAPLGAGDLGWEDILAALTAAGYHGSYVLEPHSVRAHRSAAWTQAVTALRTMLAAAPAIRRVGGPRPSRSSAVQ